MEPSIRRSIREGLSVANRSWAGMGMFAASWVGIALITILGVAVTNPPAAVFEELPAEETQAPGALDEPLAIPDATPATETVSPPPQEDVAERDRLFNSWFGRAWPVLAVCVALIAAASVWLTGAQLGYLVDGVRTGVPKLAVFWRTGTQVFGSLVAAWALSLVALLALILLIGLVIVATSAIGSAVPGWLSVTVGMLLGVGLAVGLVWLLVRLSFWFIVLVADRMGPWASVKMSFRATKGRWWKVAGLGLVVALLSYAVWIPSAVLEWLGGLAGGAGATILGLLGAGLGVLASLYIGFVSLAAYIRFYEDTKASPPGAQPAGT